LRNNESMAIVDGELLSLCGRIVFEPLLEMIYDFVPPAKQNSIEVFIMFDDL
jgi:hypothetical protein